MKIRTIVINACFGAALAASSAAQAQSLGGNAAGALGSSINGGLGNLGATAGSTLGGSLHGTTDALEATAGATQTSSASARRANREARQRAEKPAKREAKKAAKDEPAARKPADDPLPVARAQGGGKADGGLTASGDGEASAGADASIDAGASIEKERPFRAGRRALRRPPLFVLATPLLPECNLGTWTCRRRTLPMHDELTTLPGIGPGIAADLRHLGIHSIKDLADSNPEQLFQRLQKITGHEQEPCLLYTFRCAAYAARTPQPKPELLKWWNWKDRRLDD